MAPLNFSTLFGITPLKNITSGTQVGFRGNGINTFQFEGLQGASDCFSTNPLYNRLTNPATLQRLAETPDVQATMAEYGITKPKVNTAAAEELRNHSYNTRILAAKIASNYGIK